MRITKFAVYGLFGIFNHEVALHLDERVTIIHGPNGYGKTSLLKLVHSLCRGSLREVQRIPFQTFTMHFEDDRHLEIERKADTLGESRSCRIRLMSGKLILASDDVSFERTGSRAHALIQRHLPFMMRIGDELWEDRNDGEIVSTDELLSRIPAASNKPEKIEWFSNLVQPLNVKIIETNRLSREPTPGLRHARELSTNTPAAIKRYALDLSKRIRATLADYAERAQGLDQSFPIRLIDSDQAYPEAISAEQLSERIKNLEEKRSRLKAAGLLERDDPQGALPTKIAESVQGVLSMYLTDVEDKLTGFDEILKRIELLQQILNAHFSYKQLKVSKEEGFAVYTDAGEILDVTRLSSGEQHLIVLLYELLFNDRPDSLILIDEPEISLHVEWQLAFLSDLQQVAKIASQDVVIATHSPQIVNDRIDLLVPFVQPGRM